VDKARRFAPNTEPIASADDDALGRKSFAERISAALAAWDLARGSLVIGIDGEWGEGKSSLMTLMRVELEGKGYSYREFQPWLFPDERSMAAEFFRVLQSAIKTASGVDRVRNAALAKLKEYGPVVASAGGAPGAAAGKFLERALAGPSVLQQRKALGDQMAKLDKAVVICVEDIDRLTPIEALRIATLIRLVGSLPNVVYLLPYDRKNFTRLLDLALTQTEPSAEGPRPMGEGFCERLVQLDIRLPRATAAELTNLLDRAVAAALGSAGLAIDDETTRQALQRFFEMYQISRLGVLFKTPRDITRYAGSLALVLAASAGQVHLLDMLLLEVLRLHVPTVYEQLRLDPQRYAGGGSLVEQLTREFGETEEQRRKAQQGDLLGKLQPPVLEPTKRILKVLLPQVFGDAAGTQERRTQLRFGEPQNIERYFRFGLTPSDVSYVELKDAIDAADGGNEKLLVALLAGERAESVVLALSDATEAGDDAFRGRVVSALRMVSPHLKPEYAAFGNSSWERLAILFGTLLLRMNDQETLDIIKTAPPEFIVYSVRLMDAEKDPRLADAQGAMRQAASQRIVDALSTDELWKSVAPLGMYVAVLKAWQPANVRQLVGTLLEGHSERARMLLASRVEPALKAGPVVMREASLLYAELKDEVDPKKLLEIADSDPAKSHEHIELLRKAIEADAG